MENRPDGSTATLVGWLLVVIGVVAAFFTASAETSNGWLFGLAIVNLGLGLGVLLLSLGYLVKAIWFLPGREPPSPQQEPAIGAALVKCDWCGRTPAAGSPCSQIPHDKLVQIATKITSPVCQEQLAQHGFGIAT